MACSVPVETHAPPKFHNPHWAQSGTDGTFHALGCIWNPLGVHMEAEGRPRGGLGAKYPQNEALWIVWGALSASTFWPLGLFEDRLP